MLIAAFRGWNDGGQGASLAGRLPREDAGTRDASPRSTRRASSTSRRRGLTSGSRTGYTRRIDWPETVFYHARPDGNGPRRGAAARRRAEPALAHVLGARRRLRARARRRARGHARRAARGRPAHARGAGHGQRDRSGADRAARPPGLALRGADRDRRGRPRRVPAGEHRLGEPLGRRAALRLARALSEGGGRAVRAARRRCSAPRSTPPSSTRRPTRTSARSARRSRRDEETAAYVEELERRVDELDESDLPSGESLAAELSRFLREREEQRRQRNALPRATSS